ncbi:hypothetical protein [Pimelobacter simplex]|uniref:hypothetical protein n=1 Tax=Nocardioides simplex TaxID=2045 RepID=UPI003AAC99BF
MTASLVDRAMGRHGPIISAWAAAHGLSWRWGGGVVASWAAVSLFAAITVPLKYPYEAIGTVVDSGVIVGLIVPIAVSGTVLFEGPRDLVRLSARSLAPPRIPLLAAVYAVTCLAAGVTAWAAALPVAVVVVDAMLLAALLAVGVSLLGVGLGWILPGLCTFVFSAPGLIPWDYNVLYQRDVSATYLVGVAVALIVGLVAYALCGSRDRVVDRSLQEH